MKEFLLLGSFPDSLLHFRGALLEAVSACGFHVHVAAPGLTPGSSVRRKLEEIGMVAHDVVLSRTGMNPMGDVQTFWAFLDLMRAIRPQWVLAYTAKPVIYGLLAAAMARVPHRYALITGLGYAFTEGNGVRRRALRMLLGNMYRAALATTHGVFFQNPDDQGYFQAHKILMPFTRSFVVSGSGISLDQFQEAPVPAEPVFLMIGRLLGDKGIREYIQAARQVRARFPHVRFLLAGWRDENPDAVAPEELNAWVREETVEYAGRVEDVRPLLASCSVYVLPSYREGMPRTVLEAMATGRAIITTDVPGCRETVIPGENGFLVPVKSVDALVEAMIRFVEDPELARRMGRRSRRIAEAKYDVHAVNAMMLRAMGMS